MMGLRFSVVTVVMSWAFLSMDRWRQGSSPASPAPQNGNSRTRDLAADRRLGGWRVHDKPVLGEQVRLAGRPAHQDVAAGRLQSDARQHLGMAATRFSVLAIAVCP